MAFRSSLAGSECMEIGKEELNCGLLAQMHNVNATMFDRYGDADDFLHSVVLAAFTRSKQRYGAPRLTDELRAQGYHFNVKTVAASLRRQGLRAKASRKFSPVSYRAHGLPVSENLLEQDFYASGPNQKWAGDITYLRTDEVRLHPVSTEPHAF